MKTFLTMFVAAVVFYGPIAYADAKMFRDIRGYQEHSIRGYDIQPKRNIVNPCGNVYSRCRQEYPAGYVLVPVYDSDYRLLRDKH